MPRGSKPGERRGGRQKGSRNISTAARRELIAQEIKASGQRLAIERLNDVASQFENLARQYAPGTEKPDEAKFAQYMSKVASILADLAPYQSSKLQSTTLVGDREKPITHTLNVRFV